MHFKFRFIHFAPYVVHLVESLQRLIFWNGGSRMDASFGIGKKSTAIASEKWHRHDAIALPKQTESGKNGGPFGVVRWSWP